MQPWNEKFFIFLKIWELGMTLSLTPVSLAFLPVTLESSLWQCFFSLKANSELTSLCVWGWFPSVSVTRRHGRLCPAPGVWGGRAPQSLSPQLTKMCHFIIISGCQQCSLPPTLARCISAPEFGDLTHKNHPQRQPGPADHLHSPKDQRWLKLRPLCL